MEYSKKYKYHKISCVIKAKHIQDMFEILVIARIFFRFLCVILSIGPRIAPEITNIAILDNLGHIFINIIIGSIFWAVKKTK